jgi:hypothetical protein
LDSAFSKHNLTGIPPDKFFALSSNFWKITSAIYVSEAIKKAVQKEKLTGIEFNKTLVTSDEKAELPH